MPEKPSLYDEMGRVQDQEIARKMAKVEDPYHKRRAGGMLKSKKEMVLKGEHLGAEVGAKMHKEKLAQSEIQEHQELVERFRNTLLEALERNHAFVQALAKKNKVVIDCISEDDELGGRRITFRDPTERRRTPNLTIHVDLRGINGSGDKKEIGLQFATPDEFGPRSLYPKKDLERIIAKVKHWAETYGQKDTE